jgi:hypothetical protein
MEAELPPSEPLAIMGSAILTTVTKKPDEEERDEMERGWNFMVRVRDISYSNCRVRDISYSN